jgi:hypothetical protein
MTPVIFPVFCPDFVPVMRALFAAALGGFPRPAFRARVVGHVPARDGQFHLRSPRASKTHRMALPNLSRNRTKSKRQR